jgi:hypothetical protein
MSMKERRRSEQILSIKKGEAIAKINKTSGEFAKKCPIA